MLTPASCGRDQRRRRRVKQESRPRGREATPLGADDDLLAKGQYENKAPACRLDSARQMAAEDACQCFNSWGSMSGMAKGRDARTRLGRPEGGGFGPAIALRCQTHGSPAHPYPEGRALPSKPLRRFLVGLRWSGAVPGGPWARAERRHKAPAVRAPFDAWNHRQ
jgi:hypothetical protein